MCPVGFVSLLSETVQAPAGSIGGRDAASGLVGVHTENGDLYGTQLTTHEPWVYIKSHKNNGIE